LLQKAFDSMSDVVFILDAEKLPAPTILECNKSASTIFGYEKEEMLGKTTAFLHVSEEALKEFQTLLYSTIEERHPFILPEYHMRRKDGSVFPTWHSVAQLLNEEGKRIGWVSIVRDITEQKRTEEILRESEERYRTLFLEALDAILVADAETGIILDCNRAACELVGRERSELIGKHQRILHPFVSEEEFSETFKQHLKEKAGQVLETQVVTKTGEIKEVAIKATPIEHRGKKLLQGIFRDVTEHKRMVDALRESEWRVRSFLDASPEPITVSDLVGRVVECNQATLNLLGFSSKGEVVGRSAFEFIAEKDRERALENLKKTLEQGYTRDIEYTSLAKDGREFPAELSASVVLDAQGNPTAFVAITKDISERRVREEQLRFNSLILGNISDSITVTDMEGRITFWSKGASAVYGYAAEEMLGGFVAKLSKPEERATVALAQIERIRNGAPFTGEWEGVKKNGEPVWMMLTDLPMKNSQGETIGILSIGKDITERKRAEAELRETRDYLDSLIDKANVPVIVFNSELEVTRVNVAAEDLSGYRADEVMGNSLDMLFPDADKAKFMKLVESSILDDNELRLIEIPVKRKDGEIRIFLWNSANIHDVKGNIISIIAEGEDITERKRMEATLRESEARYRVIVESSPNFLALYQDGVLKFVNRAMCERLGYTNEEMTSPSFNAIERIVSERFQAVVKERGGKRLSGEHIPPYEIMMKTRDGSEFPVEVRNQRVIYQGKPALEIILVDVTERKRMEVELKRYSTQLEELVEQRTKALSESEQKYRELTDLLPQTIFEIDMQGKLTFANRIAFETFGYTRDEFDKGLNPLQMVIPEDRDRAMANIQKVLAGEEIGFNEYRVQRKDGSTLPVIVKTSPIIRENQPVGLRGIVVDITERKRLEEALLKAERLATIAETAAMVGHDLRNPLQTLANISYLGKERLKAMPCGAERQGLEDVCGMIGSQVAYMDKIVSDLQDYAQPLKPKLYATSLRQLIDDVLSTVSVPETVKVAVTVGEDFPKLMIDPLMMRRVFTNLVTNALQAMPEGGQLTITASQTEEVVLISVQDTGVGIPEEALPKLFYPLYTTKAKGVGLGLAVCQRLVEAHGGSITVESQVGRGSTFTVKLPVRREMS